MYIIELTEEQRQKLLELIRSELQQETNPDELMVLDELEKLVD